MERQQPKTPELDRQKAIELEWLHIKDFLEWLLDEKHIRLARFIERPLVKVFYDLGEIGESRFDLLHEYFKLDPAKLEEERRLLLDWVREMQKH